jgi:hypothetical protein
VVALVDNEEGSVAQEGEDDLVCAAVRIGAYQLPSKAPVTTFCGIVMAWSYWPVMATGRPKPIAFGGANGAAASHMHVI